MATKPTVGITTVGRQRDRRYLDTFHDNHRWSRFPLGRPWFGDRELAANRENNPRVQDGFCTAELQRGTHFDPAIHQSKEEAWKDIWNAPWYPEQRFFHFDYPRKRIVIQYVPMIAEDTKYYDAYYDAAAKIAYEKSWAPIEYGAVVPRQIVAILTRPPRSPKIAQAAQAGDPWLIGATDEVNEELAMLLGLSRRGFVQPKPAQQIGEVPPDAVLSMSASDLQKLIAEGVRVEMERQANERKAKMANVRAGRGKASQAEKPAA